MNRISRRDTFCCIQVISPRFMLSFTASLAEKYCTYGCIGRFAQKHTDIHRQSRRDAYCYTVHRQSRRDSFCCPQVVPQRSTDSYIKSPNYSPRDYRKIARDFHFCIENVSSDALLFLVLLHPGCVPGEALNQIWCATNFQLYFTLFTKRKKT